MKVICISAKARHGKDTAAELMKKYLESIGAKVLITHYADLLKFICTTFFGWDGKKDDIGRSILQHVGTDTIRKYNPDYWVDFIIDILKMFESEWDFVLIPDCRFPNEAEKMREHFDTRVIRIERPNFNSGLSEEQLKHASEISMDKFPFDIIISNDSDLESLRLKLVEYLLQEYAEKF